MTKHLEVKLIPGPLIRTSNLSWLYRMLLKIFWRIFKILQKKVWSKVKGLTAFPLLNIQIEDFISQELALIICHMEDPGSPLRTRILCRLSARLTQLTAPSHLLLPFVSHYSASFELYFLLTTHSAFKVTHRYSLFFPLP